jgi:hypothetical protein
VNEVINTATLEDNDWHPRYDCSGHTYIICPYNKEGFEIDTKLHKSHTCNHTYKSWLLGQQRPEQSQSEQSQSESQSESQTQDQNEEKQKSNQKNVVVEEEAEIINAIDMILPEEDERHEEPCKKCHNEITKLKQELEEFHIWRDLIMSSMPQQQQKPGITQDTDVKPESKPKVKPESKPKVKPELKPKVKLESRPKVKLESKPKVKPESEPKVKPESEPKVKPESKPRAKAAKPKIQASKKEIEKGMWCTTCDACNTVAQFTTDLKSCCNCKKMTHFNDDLTGCYHWQCVVCSQNSCYSCVKSAGGNKLRPFCSTKCALIYRSRK